MWNRSRPEWVLPPGRRFTHKAPEEGESIKNKSVDVIYGATLQNRAQRFRCVSKQVESLLKQTVCRFSELLIKFQPLKFNLLYKQGQATQAQANPPHEQVSEHTLTLNVWAYKPHKEASRV